MTTQSFQMAATIEAVDPMVLTLTKAVKSNLGKDANMRFQICIIEALTNLVEHGQTGKEQDPIDVTLTRSNGRATIEIFDVSGTPAFDLRDHAPDIADVDPLSETGRGMALILQCADKIEYGEHDGRNRLSLGFHDAK